MITYKHTRTRGKSNRDRQRLAEVQAQLNQLKIENQALKAQLTNQKSSLNGTPLSPSLEKLAGLELDHKEGLLGYFLDYSSTQAFVNSTDGHYLYANDAFAHYLGSTPENVVGHSVYDFFPPDLASNYLTMNQDVFNNHKIIKFIEPVQDKNGETSYVLTSIFPLPVKPGVEWVGGLTIDITDYVLIEKASKQTEERLRRLVNQLPIYLFDIDTRGIITLLEGKGFTSESGPTNSMVGKPIEELLKDYPEVREYYRRAMTGESFSTIMRTPDNNVYELHGSPVLDDEGKVKNITGLALDITSQTQIREKLRQSEQRFIKVFNSAPMPIAICRVTDGTFLDVNKAFTDFCGYTEQELVDRSIFQLLEDIPDYRNTPEGIKLAEAFLSTRNLEVTIRNNQQERLDLLVSAEQVDFDGEKCFIATCLDVTKQKKIEEAKRETEERLHAILYNSPVFIFAKDREGRYLMFNRYCEQYSNLLAKDVIGKTTYEVFDDDHEKADSFVRVDQEVLLKGKSIVVEDETTQDGKTYYDITTKFPMFDSKGQVYAVGGISIDITDRKEAGKALAAEKEQLAVTLSSIADGVITTNTDGKILLINRVAQEITGWTQQAAQHELLEQVFKLLDPRTLQPVSNPVCKVLANGILPEVASPSYLLLARDGSEHPIEVSTAPIYDEQGRSSGSVLVFRDISEKLKMIEEHQKVARLESLGLLAGGIAHDFNNLLTAIVGSISVARAYGNRPGMESKLDQSLERAEKACMQSKSLTQQLLTFARGGAPIKQKASLIELVHESADFVLQGSEIQRRYELSSDLWLVEVDPSQLSQVIQNLVLNAVQAMPDGGNLTLLAENLEADHPDLKGLSLLEEPYVRVTFQDTGTGILAENLTRIFDPYYTTKETGSGLGLAICYSVIRNHQGHIQVQSILGQGTTFSIYLPALETAQLIIPVKLPDYKPVKVDHQKNRVLVMEDDLAIRNLLVDILDLLDYEVETSINGEEALQFYEEAITAKRPFTVVIMDLTIPGGMGGREAIQKLKERHPKAKAIVSSGYANDLALADYQEIGFNGLISKPYRVKDLAAILEKVIQN